MAKRICAWASALVVVGGLAPATASASEQTAKALLELEHPVGLTKFVRKVSDPASPRYRDYSSVERLARRFGADPRAKRAALRWVERAGGTGRLSPTGDFIVATVPDVAAARLRISASRAGSPALPVSITRATVLASEPAYERGPVVAPARRPTRPRDSQLPHSGTAAGCAEGQAAGAPAPNTAFTPNQYLTAYGHDSLHQRGFRGRGARIAVVEIDGFDPTDIATFGACFGIRIPPLNLHTVGVPGPLPPGGETTLDLQLLSATAPEAKSIEIYEGGDTQAAVLESTIAAIASKRRRPDVISISLGDCEADLTGQLAATRLLDRVFAVAAGSGISTFVAAGDQGSTACRRGTAALPLLAVSNPADSPFVTAVGGTNLSLDPENRIAGQVTWNDAPSLYGGGGGGLSVLYDAPWWQQRAAGKVGSEGARVVPDVAALADVTPGYGIFCTAAECAEFPQTIPGWVAVGGTSAATPLTAGGIALANQAARERGQPPLGLINPLLYAAGAKAKTRARVFNDVTVGDNDLSSILVASGELQQPLGCCAAGPGYDPATGWGSLDIPAFDRYATRAAR